MDKVVLEGMESIINRINLSTGFVHPDDKGCTIELLKKLKKAGYTLDPIEISSWASRNGLEFKDAEVLKDYVIGVNSDKRFQIGNSPYWKENIVAVLEERTK